MPDWIEATTGLHTLRHELISEGHELGYSFHATTDKQAVRDRVFSEIMKHDFSVQATICEKSKAQPKVTSSKAQFYKTPWFYHCKIGIKPRLGLSDEPVITAASIGTKKEKLTFYNALKDVRDQNANGSNWIMDFRPCQSDYCMQIADYCAWAIQRKWELGDERSYSIISPRLTREYDLWEHGSTHYY